MARFLYWPSKVEIPHFVYTVAKGTQSKVADAVAVAECMPEFDVKLVKIDGRTPANGSAELDQDKKQGLTIPIILTDVSDGDQVQVLHKVTGNAWSLPLKIRIGSDTAKDAKVRADQYAGANLQCGTLSKPIEARGLE